MRMTEYEKLKEVCDMIEYEYHPVGKEFECTVYDEELGINQDIYYKEIKDVRETIFTQEFMDKLVDYLEKRDWIVEKDPLYYFIMKNLNDPTDYIYNLLRLWNQ